MKDHPATIIFALAGGVFYLAVAGVREYTAMRGPFTGELGHLGLEYPLRWSLETLHAYERISHSHYGEFLFFGALGTMLYFLAGAFIGCALDAFLFRGIRRDENVR